MKFLLVYLLAYPFQHIRSWYLVYVKDQFIVTMNTWLIVYMKKSNVSLMCFAVFWLAGGSFSLESDTGFIPLMKLSNFVAVNNIQIEQGF